MVTYGKICDAIKKLDNNIEFVNLLKIHECVIEERITNKGEYRLTLSFSAKQVLRDPKCLPSKPEDFIYRPYLLIIKNKRQSVKQ